MRWFSEIDLCNGVGIIKAITSGASTSVPHYDSISIESQEIEMHSQRYVATITNVGSTTPTYQNTSQIYTVSYKTSAGSYARLESECKETSSGDLIKTGFSAMADITSSTAIRAMMYAETWDESAGKWSNSNQVNVYPTKTTFSKYIVIDGTKFTGKNKTLWSGTWYMQSGQTATLSESVTSQANGIVLVFSLYEDSSAKNQEFFTHFIPKSFCSLHDTKGVSISLLSAWGNSVKYLYVGNTSIVGHENNDISSKTVGGITYNNRRFVMRYVIGV